MLSRMLKYIDSIIDNLTMYRLLRYYLSGLLIVAFGLGVTGVLSYSPLDLLADTLIALTACWTINKVLGFIFQAPVSSDSSIITAFILALIITPRFDTTTIAFLLAASGLAMASKYILTIRRKHIFNPAAIAVVLTGFGGHQLASWWIGSTVMMPFVIIGGLLIVRKVRRGKMVASFLLTTTVATALFTFLSGSDVLVGLKHMVLSSAVLFLGFVMLTEPMTSPPTKGKQVWYGALVGLLLPPQVHIFNLYSTPELALAAGNIFSYLVSPKTRLFPVLKQKVTVSANTMDFVFSPGQEVRYSPGQYMEWTLPHTKPDSRGNRRYFTLASSPTEPELRVGVKFYDTGSSFKRALGDMPVGAQLAAGQIAGDFVLPKDPDVKLAFIAGGIGITPFRSMIKYLTDTADTRSVTLLYGARTRGDIAYRNIFEDARRKIRLKTVYVISGETAARAEQFTRYGTTITADMIKTEIPDYLERTFYLSGTHPMVESMHHVLAELGVHRSRIKTDFFPGYA